jgi:steroid delta-isomerase-like uncharacterized protein
VVVLFSGQYDIMSDMFHKLICTWNEHNLDRLAMLYAEDFEGKDVGLAQTYYGLVGIRQMAETYYKAFPDLIFTATETIVDGNRAALSWTSTGTHLGKIMNIPPTGRTIKVSGITTVSIQNGLIVRSSVLWDVAGLLREIGLLPDL